MFPGIILKCCGCAVSATVTQSVGCGLAMDGTELCAFLCCLQHWVSSLRLLQGCVFPQHQNTNPDFRDLILLRKGPHSSHSTREGVGAEGM